MGGGAENWKIQLASYDAAAHIRISHKPCFSLDFYCSVFSLHYFSRFSPVFIMDEIVNDDNIEQMLFDIPSGSESSDLDSEDEIDDFLISRANVFLDSFEDYLSITSPTTRAAALYDEQRLQRNQEANTEAPVLAR